MDCDGEMALDIGEMEPFYTVAFKVMFGLVPEHEQVENLFHLMDTDGSGDLGFAEVSALQNKRAG